MILIIQIMNHMMANLEYTPEEVAEHFASVEAGKLSIPELLDVVGVDASFQGIDRMKLSLPKWRSALAVTKMRMESVCEAN